MDPKWLLFLFLSMFIETEAQATSTEKRIYCGRQLSSILSTVCRGNYNTFGKKSLYQKKTYFDTENYASDDPYAPEVSYPFTSKESAQQFRKKRRRRRGVYDECCQKACSYDELMTYCAPTQRRKRR